MSNRLRYVYVFLLGALGALSYPPLGWFWVVFITIPAYLFILSTFTTAPNKSRFAVGWWFGFGHFVASLYWIANALFVDFAKFFWLYPFALIGIPAAIGVYHGLISLLTTRFKTSAILFALSFAFLWLLSELIRGQTLLAFPWNLIGLVWSQNLEVLQITYLIGIYGLSAATILAIALIYLSWRQNIMWLLVPLIGFGGIYKYGYDRLRDNPTSYAPNSALIRLVQPGVTQQDKWNSTKSYEHFKDLLQLSIQSSAQPRLIIWPESAVTFLLAEQDDALDYINKILPPGASLITGVTRRQFLPNNKFNLYTSAIAITGGKVQAKYDKSHLVPFGEYLPLRAIIPNNISKITAGSIDYTPGNGPETIQLRNIPAFSPMICFEAVFSGKVVDKNNRPQWLLNLTNDAWYGNSSGPYQHLYNVRIRAIEEGLPLVRVANTGISAVIDPCGRIIKKLAYNSKGTIDFYLPKPII